VDNGKLTESKLATLDSLIAALLYHDRELKRTGKVNLALGRRGVSRVSYSNSQRLSNGKYCSHYKCDGHIEKDCWQKRPKRPLKSGDRKKKHNRKDDDNRAPPHRREIYGQPEKPETKESELLSYEQPNPDRTEPLGTLDEMRFTPSSSAFLHQSMAYVICLTSWLRESWRHFPGQQVCFSHGWLFLRYLR
jgi:hypothetical protein